MTRRLIILLWGLSSPLSAQAPSASMDAFPRPAAVGDRILITVSVEHAASDSVAWPEILDVMGSFEVADAELIRPVVNGDRLTSDLQLVVSAFELGDLEFPALPVFVIANDGDRTTDLTTDPLIIPIQSVGLDEGGGIRDIKPQLVLVRSAGRLFLLAVIFALLGAVAYWLYRRYRKRNRPEIEATVPVVPARPPEEEAFEALDRLGASTLLDQQKFKRYYVEASQIIRGYIHGRFGIDAMEMDTHDIIGALKSQALPMALHQRFTNFFDDCDLVKFAKHRPDRHRADQLVPQARELVQDTTPAAALSAPLETAAV